MRTPLALSLLGTTLAYADPEPPRAEGMVMTGEIGGSVRGVAQNYLVLPSGAELTTDLKFVTAGDSLGGRPLAFSDLGLFGVTARVSVLRRLELAGGATFVPKQPSYTDE